MILLDTNVLSELMRPAPETKVIHWLDNQSEMEIWICAVTVAEIRLGLALLPEGRRKNDLMDLADQMFQDEFAGQCLPFDCEAAAAYSQVVAQRNQSGRPISVEDAQIASIALVGGLALATRNTKDFDGIAGLSVVNPWIG